MPVSPFIRGWIDCVTVGVASSSSQWYEPGFKEGYRHADRAWDGIQEQLIEEDWEVYP